MHRPAKAIAGDQNKRPFIASPCAEPHLIVLSDTAPASARGTRGVLEWS